MEFGPWLRSVRQKRGLDLRDAAYLTEVDPSTINRIENERTQATLGTAISICQGLGIDIRDFIRAFFGEENTANFAPITSNESNAPALTFTDVTYIVDNLYKDPELGLQLLAGLVSEAIYAQNYDEHKTAPPPFTEDDVLRLFVSCPVYDYSLNYPPNFESDDIAHTFAVGGTLTFTDVGVYIRGVRRAKQKTLAGLREKTQRSVSVLSRIEAGSLERIKLQDVLTLDKELGTNNEILRMFWKAAELSYEIVDAFDVRGFRVNNADYVEVLVTAFRWMQATRRVEVWLPRLRSWFNEERE